MMMMHFHGVMALELLALVAGMLLLHKVCNAEICCRLFFKVVAYFVIIVSMLMIVCSVWHGVAALKDGGFCMRGKCPMMGGMMGPEMGPGMGPMMKDRPMMKMMPPMEPGPKPANP